ncbi:MAG: sensor histidine kinase [Candidatus Xenobia bacterium]
MTQRIVRPAWLSPIRTLSRMVASFTDRSVLQEEKAALERKSALVDERNRKKDEFVRTVAHELRIPLTGLRGSVSLLQSSAAGEMSPQAGQLLDLALRNIDRMGRLIHDLLDVERLESGALPLAVVPCDAYGLASLALAVVGPQSEAAGVTVQLEGEPSPVQADPDRIVQVLTNLISNAVKFSPRGSTVRVRVRPQGSNVVLEVEDRGRGIPAADLERIFEPFAQVALADDREKGGTGLGLAISRAIVQQHGGRLSATSEGGVTRFTAVLPVGSSR